MRIPTYLIRLINSFIRNRSFAVHINNHVSSKIETSAGLAQGTCLSPLLYSLYEADMPSDENVQLALYADDTAVYTSAKNSNTIIKRLNNEAATLSEYFKMWKIKINAAKTQAIIFPFNKSRRRTPTIDVNSDSKTIQPMDSVSYLGIVFDKKLSFKNHIDAAINKTNKCFRAMLPLLAPKSTLSTLNKARIYRTIIRPIASYGSPTWATATTTTIKNKLNIMQNKISSMK